MGNRHVVVMTGTSEDANGGITAVIRLIKKMTIWEKYNIYWLTTQTNEIGKKSKFLIALKAAFISPAIMWNCKIVHFHIVPGITLIVQLPELLIAKLLRKIVILEVHVGNQLEPYSTDNFFKWWFRRADLILLLARRWEKSFKELYCDVKVPTDVLYNACEVRPYLPMKNKQKLILFAGTHDSNKAPDILIKAWSILKEKYPDWRLAFLGSGDVNRYKQMSVDLGLSDCIDFTGFITGDCKERYFHEASILCLCSYMEGFPMAVLEAWSYSISVITTPVGGLPDVIDEGVNCLTFPFGNSEALSKQLDRIISNDTLRANIAREGQLQAIKNFSLEAVNKKIDTIYSQFINNYCSPIKIENDEFRLISY